MGFRITALLAAISLASPALAGDPVTGFSPQATASTMFFVSIPLDAGSRKQREPVYGFALQGRQAAVAIDNKLLANFGLETLAGLEIKWVLAGAAAVGLAAAVGTNNPTRAAAQASSQAQQQAIVTGSTGTGGTGTSTGATTGGTTSIGGGTATTVCPPTPSCPNH